MARKPITDMPVWPSLTLEGNLIAPAKVAQISEPKNDADTQESYEIRKGLTIREEISTAFRVGQSHFDAFANWKNPSVEATRRFICDFLKETFGFDDLVANDGVVSLVGGGRVPIVVVPPAEEKLDRRSPTLSTDLSRSPASALQDYLNGHDKALWGLVSNGVLIRLLRDSASLTRPAYIEADLAQIFENQDIASFAILWLMIHRSRFGAAGAPATNCALERWRQEGAREGEAARDRLANQVRRALKILGSGFLEANPKLAAKLRVGEVDLTEWFNELLRLVYRLIFLMVAEDKNLLHPEKAKAEARELYAEGYSLAALRTQCFRAAIWDKHYDRFEGIKVVFRALTHGEERLALPALGGLFSEDKLPHLETARLRNKDFMEALYRLSCLPDKTGMVPVNWRMMETEELGSVYESLLELQPQLEDDGKTLVFAAEAAEQKGNQRKTTGSYYTPDSLVQALLDTTLDPVLDKTAPDKLLSLAIIDPACGSGHFLLAAAHRLATRLACHRAEGTPTLSDFRHALRDVARSCLHGVDRNPMAVELTKVALWIETVDPGLPLGFFDAQIRCGDALLGVFDLKVLKDGIPDDAYKPLTGDDKPTAKYYLQANKDAKEGQGSLGLSADQHATPAIKPLALDFLGFRDLPEDTVEQIGAKALRLEELRKKPAFIRAKAAADLYVAAFLLPKVGGAPSGPSAHTVPTTAELWEMLSPNQGKTRQAMADARKAAHRARAFHWPLEFPDIMQRGGFDVVVGNPPWERIKLQEKEFFAARSPEIADAPNKAARDKLIKALVAAPKGSAERGLFDAFTAAKRVTEATSAFVRVPDADGGRFALTGRGDVNTYALFAELFANLARTRAGVIVPTGIATDTTTSAFFGDLMARNRLTALFDFENRNKLFAAVDSRFRFSILAIWRDAPAARFAFFLTDTAQLAEAERNVTLSPEDIKTFNPNTRTVPLFRSRADAELTAKIYSRTSVLIEDGRGKEGNPWGLSFMTMFHMSNDSHLFRTAAQLFEDGFSRIGTDWVLEGKRFLPLYEAKMVHIYDHRWSSYGEKSGTPSKLSSDDKANPRTEPSPHYWVAHDEVFTRLSKQGWDRAWLFGWRDITNTTNERTMICSPIPRVGVGNKMPLIFSDAELDIFCALLANLSSLTFDYSVRQKIGGTSFNFFLLKQMPILPPAFYTKHRLAFLTPKVLELTYTSHSMAPFARDLGYDGRPFTWDENRRAHLRADLDAFYARAYGLSRDELRYILDPADVKGPDYPSETFRVLKKNEIREYDEYRTRRLVLAAWDRMQANGEFTAMEMS